MPSRVSNLPQPIMPSGPNTEIQNAGAARSVTADPSITNYGSGTQNNNTGAGNQYNAQKQYFGVQNSPEDDDPLQDCQDCQKSLAFLEMSNRSNDIDGALEGTCEWLPRQETYRDWAGRHRGLLWIKGKPGSGKSTLLKHLRRRVEAESGMSDKAVILSFFFHGRGGELQRTPLGLFRSLLHQLLDWILLDLKKLVDRNLLDLKNPLDRNKLCERNPLQGLVGMFKHRRQTMGDPGKKWGWHVRELQGFFESSMPKVLEKWSVWLFVDALDESGKANAIDLVKQFKSLLQKLPSAGLRFGICFTCRHYPILDWNYGLEICLERENERDILTYVKTRLTTGNARAIHLITDRAAGVFLWAYLVVDRVLELDLEGEGSKIEAEIQRIPPDLDALYYGLIQSMKARLTSRKLIQWICFSAKPLSIDELRWAMAVDPDCSHKSLQQCQQSEDYTGNNETMERRIKTLSCGLAETVPSFNSRSVQFIHQSVKDFFIEKGLSALAPLDGSLVSSDLAVGRAHYSLSRTCIRYLAMEEIVRSIVYGRVGLETEFPLLRYATTSWVSHTRQGEAKGICQDDLLQYFSWPSEGLMQLWVRVYQAINGHSRDCPPEGTSLLHIVSRYELTQLLSVILQKADQLGIDINCRDHYGWTPLLWATEQGHDTIIKLLLDTGKVDVNARDKYDGGTPLWRAAERGHETIVKLLLDTGKVDVDARDKYNGGTPLWRAADRGHETIVKLLLD
ncbi:hypothetical protein EDB81DRAFT_674526, partial [Dactylonectria macrodidyma]